MEKRQYRHELKFLCSESTLQLIENRIRHICKQDSYARDTGTYIIRSLYFDTYHDNCLLENAVGVDDREKYRLRIYNGDTDVIKLECKSSLRNMKAKEVCFITRSQCERLINGEPVRDVEEHQTLLQRFLWERSIKLLTPKVIVEYVRTPYIYSIGNVRVTFDRHICSSVQVAHFLGGEIVHREILPENVHLLEVKYNEVLPTIVLDRLIGGQQLQKTSFSKYVMCRSTI